MQSSTETISLHEAAKQGDITSLTALLAAGKDVEYMQIENEILQKAN